MEALAFATDFDLVSPCDLKGEDFADLRKVPGAYILIANTTFNYPRGKSPIFYIGQSAGLFGRLHRHQDRIGKASAVNREHTVYRPVYEYGAKHDVQVVIIKSETPRKTEFELLARFAMTYRSLPVANNCVNWAQVRKRFPVGIVADDEETEDGCDCE